MTLARRLLMAGGGVGSFSPPVTLAATSLAVTGFWNNISEPRSATYNGKTYIGYSTSAGDIYVVSYTHATGAVSTPFLVGTGFSSISGNIHNSIALLVRSSDHKLLLVESAEAAAQPFARISTNAEDATAWASAFTILASGSYTYPSLFQLASGTIYLFIKRLVSGTYYLAYSTSSDGGATWSGLTNLVSPVAMPSNSANNNYWRIGCDGISFHIMATDTERTDAFPSSVYHLRFDGTTLYKSDGTSLGTTFPVLVTNGTLVQDTTYGRAWSEGVAFDGSSNPSTVLLAYDSGTTQNHIRHARWTGSAWSVNAVADTAGVINSNKFIAGASINKATPTTIYANVKVGSHFELTRYTSADNGATWTSVALTSGSSSDNAMPDTPTNASAVSVVWGYGTYTNDSTYTFTVYVAG